MENKAQWLSRLKRSELPKADQPVKGEGEPVFVVARVKNCPLMRLEEAIKLAEKKKSQVLPRLNVNGAPWRFPEAPKDSSLFLTNS